MRRKNLDCEKSQQTVGNMFQPFQLCRAAGNKLLTQMDTDMPWNCENVGAYNLIHWYCRAQDETAIQSRWVFFREAYRKCALEISFKRSFQPLWPKNTLDTFTFSPLSYFESWRPKRSIFKRLKGFHLSASDERFYFCILIFFLSRAVFFSSGSCSQ